MKWREKSNLHKAVLVGSLLLLAADWTLVILDVLGVLAYNRGAENLLRAAFFFGFGFANCLGKRKIWYVLAVYSVFRCLLNCVFYFL